MNHIKGSKIVIKPHANNPELNGTEPITYAVLNSFVDGEYRIMMVRDNLKSIKTIYAASRRELAVRFREAVNSVGEIVDTQDNLDAQGLSIEDIRSADLAQL